MLLVACKDGAGDTAASVLDGEGLAWDALPSEPAPEPTDWVETGPARFAADRLLLLVDEDTTVEELNLALAPFDAEAVGGDTDLGLLELRLDAPADALLALEDHFVVSLEIDAGEQRLPQAHISPTGLDPSWEWTSLDGGSGWGLKSMAAPYAWNLVDSLSAEHMPRVAILDGGFVVHDDLPLTVEANPSSGIGDHGNMVASCLAGRHNDKGVEGVFPRTDELPLELHVHGMRPARTASKLRAMKAELLAGKAEDKPVVLSMSLGLNYLNPSGGGVHQDFPDSTLPEAFGGDGRLTFMDAVRNEGRAFQAFEQRARTRLGVDDWLMFCSAGNSNVNEERNGSGALTTRTYMASENSGCAYAATELGVSRFLAVEAIDRVPGDAEFMAHMSHRGGTLAAPGIGIGMTTTSWYGVASGTSFATPYAAGAAALLWTVAPDADADAIRAALLRTRAVDQSAGTLDLRLALAALDEDHVVALADVDDGTPDGRARLAEDNVTGLGDGCVDERDFRALRDALLDQPWPEGNANLDGELGRDLNGDGLVYWDPDRPSWWTLPVEEHRYSRFDLDGDGTLGSGDVAVMQAAWGRCVDGEIVDTAWTADELPAMVRSLDLWIPTDQPGIASVGDQVTVLDPDQGSTTLWTVPVSACTGLLELHVTNAEGTHTFRTAEPVAEGMDIVVLGGDLRLLDNSVPLVHWQNVAQELSWQRYSASGGFGSSTDIGTLGGGLSAKVALDGSVAGDDSGGVSVVLASESSAVAIVDPNLSDEYAPWAWGNDSEGLLARSTSGIDPQAELIWVDVVNQAVHVVGPEQAKRWPDWPAVDPWGRIWFSGDDGHLYTVSTRAPPPSDYEGWVAELEQGATCQPELPTPVRADPFTSGSWRLVATAGSPVSSDGHVLVTDGSQLVVLSSDGEGSLVLDSSWTPRGGVEGVYLEGTDGVSWSGDGRRVAWLSGGELRLADLGSSSWTLPASASVSTLTSTQAGTVALAPFSERVVLGTFQGPISDPWMKLDVVDFGGAVIVDGLRHDLRRGTPALSGTGAQLVYVNELDANKPNLVVVETGDGGEVLDTGEWGPGWQAYPSWGLDLPVY